MSHLRSDMNPNSTKKGSFVYLFTSGARTESLPSTGCVMVARGLTRPRVGCLLRGHKVDRCSLGSQWLLCFGLTIDGAKNKTVSPSLVD